MTPDQLYALEVAARRERSRVQAEILGAAAHAVKSGVARVLSALRLKGLGHA